MPTGPTLSGRGAVASGSPETTAAGLTALEQGGNAMDALVAAALAATVCEPLLTGFGGGGVINWRSADGSEAVVLDFMSTYPGLEHGLEPRDFQVLRVDYGPTHQLFHAGRGAAAVPGVAPGLDHAWKRFGTLPRAALAAPAADLARRGSRCTGASEIVATMLRAITQLSPPSAALFAPGGVPLTEGDIVRSDPMAEAVEAFGAEGAAPFVTGRYGRALVEAFGPPHGSLGMKDLAAFRVIERAPIVVQFHGSTLYAPPPPCLGGALLAFGMRLLGSLPPPQDDVGIAAALSAVMRETERARAGWFDADAQGPGAVERLLGAESIEAHRRNLVRVLAEQSLLPPDGAAPGAIPGNTTHISVVDGVGNACSYTSSNGESSGYLWPGLELPVNNFLGEDDINPDGFHLGPVGARMRTMMTPSLLVAEDGAVIALGTGGSNRIRTAMLQVVRHVVDGELPLEQAVMKPRIHVEGDAIAVEETGLPAGVLEAAAAGGGTLTRFQGRHLYFGGVHCAERTADGEFVAMGDPRRSGCGGTR